MEINLRQRRKRRPNLRKRAKYLKTSQWSSNSTTSVTLLQMISPSQIKSKAAVYICFHLLFWLSVLFSKGALTLGFPYHAQAHLSYKVQSVSLL